MRRHARKAVCGAVPWAPTWPAMTSITTGKVLLTEIPKRIEAQ
jgi:hypothetical protein